MGNLLDLALIIACVGVHGAQAVTMLVLNHGKDHVRVATPQELTIAAGDARTMEVGERERVVLSIPKASLVAPTGAYAVVVAKMAQDGSLEVALHDNNALQLELSAAVHKCLPKDGRQPPQWLKCIASHAFGGIPVNFAKKSFTRLWASFDYWHICNVAEPAPTVHSSMAKEGTRIDILRESPLVATVRGFVSPKTCKDLMRRANKDTLVQAHIGSGGGATSTSEARETLTTNFFVNWNEKNALSFTSARAFDLVSEFLGVDVPYEGQEPVNFLHYLSGFEYRPHMDGGFNETGKRVATTLIYCEAPEEGGATVFPDGKEPMRFQPGVGDLLFFQYMPDPGLQLHAACPVIAGLKSTLTQWYRLGVSSTKNWDLFENWGVFHNEHIKSRWQGPRHDPAALAVEAQRLGFMPGPDGPGQSTDSAGPALPGLDRTGYGPRSAGSDFRGTSWTAMVATAFVFIAAGLVFFAFAHRPGAAAKQAGRKERKKNK